ncbi:Spy/CpxP family protein refolding chaperone [Kaarinaea lacus]
MHTRCLSDLPGNCFILLALLAFCSATFAQPPGYMRHHMDDETMERMMDERGYGGGYGYGYGRGGHMGHMGPMMGPMMMGPMSHMMGNLNGLDLNDTQRDKIRDIQRKMRKQHWDLMEKMMDTSDKLIDLYDVDKPDAEKIGKVYDEIYKVKRQMIQQHIEVRNKIYDILNKEQRKKFKANDPFAHRFGMMF